jgi:hypothetical protein
MVTGMREGESGLLFLVDAICPFTKKGTNWWLLDPSPRSKQGVVDVASFEE